MHMSFGMPLISAEHDPHLPAFAVPANGEIARLLRLDLMNGIEHDHPVRYRGRIILKSTGLPIAAPDLKSCRLGHYFISSIICFISSVMGGSGSRA